MGKEKTAAVSPVSGVMRELFQFGIYKRTQGRIARQVTFAALAITCALGAWRLSDWGIERGPWIRYYLPALFIVAGWWLAFRLVNLPAFADFLIAVEAEMNKVSWPTRRELFRSSLVVIFCIFFLAAMLFAYDFFWRYLLDVLQVVHG